MTNWSSFGGEEKFFVPELDIKIDGQLLPREVKVDVRSVTYQDHLSQLDSFEILVNNWDTVDSRFKYSDSHQFDPGRRLELFMGYEGDVGMRRMISGEITSLRPTFPADSPSLISVSGLSALHPFRNRQNSWVYEKMRDSEIAEMIGDRLGVKVHTDPAAKAEEDILGYLLQDNQYDIVFLLERARRNGYDLFVEEDRETVYFGPSDFVKGPRNILRYGSFALELEPTLTTVDQVHSVTVRSWSAVKKELVEEVAPRGPLGGSGDGPNGGFGPTFGPRHEIITDQPAESPLEAKRLAQAVLDRIRRKMITATGRVVGIPDIRAGTVLEIEELDARFTGEYFVTASHHRFDVEGYSTYFECRREDA